MTHRMDPGELQTVREYLGLSTQALAGMLDVRHDTVRRWESGRDLIPERVRQEIEDLEEATARSVDELVAALQDARDPGVRVYRTDEQMHAARPDTAHLPARWWRHVVARACDRVPGVAIFGSAIPGPERVDEAVARVRETFPGTSAIEVEFRTCSICGDPHLVAVGYRDEPELPIPAEYCICSRTLGLTQANRLPLEG